MRISTVVRRMQQSLAGAALILASASLLSRVLGLVRDRLLSTQFGAGPELDAYFAAFKIPDFLFNVLVLGALSAAFVPVFLDRKIKHGSTDAFAMAQAVFVVIVLAVIALAIPLYIFMPQVVSLLAFGDGAAQQATIVQYTRIMLVSLLFFAMSNVVAGMLHASSRFIVYALAPICYNIGIIIGIMVFVPLWGGIGLPFGVVLGAGLHFLVQLPTAYRLGFRLSGRVQWRHPGLAEILSLLPLRAFSLGLNQFNVLILFAIASTLPVGSRSVWQFADNLQHFPINIFGVSLALAAFPVFSEAFSKRETDRFRKTFSENVRRILFFVIPISVITILLRAQIVRLVYGAGAFDWEATQLTAQTLGVFAVSMVAQALIPLLARVYFAMHNTATPVVVAIVAMAINIGLALPLANRFGIIGLALAFSVSAIIHMLLLLARLRLHYGDLDDQHIIASAAKITVAALGLGLVIQGAKYVVVQFTELDTFVSVLLQTTVAVSAGGIVYLWIAVQFQFEEAVAIWKKLRLGFRLVRKYFVE